MVLTGFFLLKGSFSFPPSPSMSPQQVVWLFGFSLSYYWVLTLQTHLVATDLISRYKIKVELNWIEFTFVCKCEVGGVNWFLPEDLGPCAGWHRVPVYSGTRPQRALRVRSKILETILKRMNSQCRVSKICVIFLDTFISSWKKSYWCILSDLKSIDRFLINSL